MQQVPTWVTSDPDLGDMTHTWCTAGQFIREVLSALAAASLLGIHHLVSQTVTIFCGIEEIFNVDAFVCENLVPQKFTGMKIVIFGDPHRGMRQLERWLWDFVVSHWLAASKSHWGAK